MSGDLCGTYVLDPQTSPFVPRDGIHVGTRMAKTTT